MEHLGKIKIIIIHHSQRDPDDSEFIKKRHLRRDFEDIGYHYLIDRKGEIHKGRSEKYLGAHVLGHNENSLGICLIGNLDKKQASKDQIKTLIKFLGEKMKKYDISIKNIKGHREFPDVIKTCPGKLTNMNQIRELLKISNS